MDSNVSIRRIATLTEKKSWTSAVTERIVWAAWQRSILIGPIRWRSPEKSSIRRERRRRIGIIITVDIRLVVLHIVSVFR